MKYISRRGFELEHKFRGPDFDDTDIISDDVLLYFSKVGIQLKSNSCAVLPALIAALQSHHPAANHFGILFYGILAW